MKPATENTYKKSQKKRENKKDPQGTAKKKSCTFGFLCRLCHSILTGFEITLLQLSISISAVLKLSLLTKLTTTISYYIGSLGLLREQVNS